LKLLLEMSAARPADPNPSTQDATRRALLDAAAEVFAEVGFRQATIRDICRKAGANGAAVNYHFRDKQGLYTEVLKASYRLALEKYPPDFGLPANPTPEQRLHAFVRSFLLRIFTPGPHSRHGRLMSREMIDPTAALDALVKEVTKPMAEGLRAIIAALGGPGLAEPHLSMCAMSVVSQVLFYHHCRPVIVRMMPEFPVGERAVEPLANHITQFCLAALRSYQPRQHTKPPSRTSHQASRRPAPRRRPPARR
jgi:AcrR family transcriptional regulator